jgi:hypothetical protein
MTYDAVLFVHILGALGIFMGLSLEWLLAAGIGRARTDAELREAAAAFGILPVLGAPSTVVVLLSGIYLATASTRWQAGWPVAAVVGLVALALIGAFFGGARPAQRASRLLQTHAALPVGLRSALRSPLPRRSVWGRLWLAVGIVYLMAVKPDLAGSLVVLAVTAAAAAVTLAAPGRRRMQAET